MVSIHWVKCAEIKIFKMELSQPLFVYFRPFHITKFKLQKSKRRCAYDSNLGLQDGWCRQIHLAMSIAQKDIFSWL